MGVRRGWGGVEGGLNGRCVGHVKCWRAASLPPTFKRPKPAGGGIPQRPTGSQKRWPRLTHTHSRQQKLSTERLGIKTGGRIEQTLHLERDLGYQWPMDLGEIE